MSVSEELGAVADAFDTVRYPDIHLGRFVYLLLTTGLRLSQRLVLRD